MPSYNYNNFPQSQSQRHSYLFQNVMVWPYLSSLHNINPLSLIQTNTFQAVIVTDEVRTYAIFNYEWMGWTTHTEAGGDTTEGQGGVPAFVGFNAGNGTKAYEYMPYSQVGTKCQY